MPRALITLALLLAPQAVFAADTPVDTSGYTLFNPVPAAALRSFSPDRPTKGTTPITVDAGHLQVETDLLSYTHSNTGGVSTRLYTALDPVLKLGITHNLDLEVQFNGYNNVSTFDPGTGARLSRNDGAGDVVVRARLNLVGNDGGIAFALVPYVKLPTASSNIGNGVTEGGIVAPVSIPLPYDFSLLLSPEVDVLKNANDAGHHFNYTNILTIGHPIGPKVTAYAEIYAALGTDRYTPPVYTFDVALAYLVGPNTQLDIGANIGLNRAAPNLQVYTGFAQRF